MRPWEAVEPLKRFWEILEYLKTVGYWRESGKLWHRLLPRAVIIWTSIARFHSPAPYSEYCSNFLRTRRRRRRRAVLSKPVTVVVLKWQKGKHDNKKCSLLYFPNIKHGNLWFLKVTSDCTRWQDDILTAWGWLLKNNFSFDRLFDYSWRRRSELKGTMIPVKTNTDGDRGR